MDFYCLQYLMQVYHSPGEPKGTPFKPINGPSGNDTRIGIVGGGIGE